MTKAALEPNSKAAWAGSGSREVREIEGKVLARLFFFRRLVG
jgi:hypothetical protein